MTNPTQQPTEGERRILWVVAGLLFIGLNAWVISSTWPREYAAQYCERDRVSQNEEAKGGDQTGLESPVDCVSPDPNAKSAEAYQPENHWPDFWIALGTVWLVCGTFYLGFWTYRLWSETREALVAAKAVSDRQANEFTEQLGVAKSAAESARRTAVALMNAERPHLLVEDLKLRGLNGTPDENGKVAVRVFYEFRNFGKTPLRLQGVAVGVIWRPPVPDEPPLLELTGRNFPVVPDGTYKLLKDVEFAKIDKDEADRIRTGKVHTFIFGNVVFLDTFRRTWITRFGYRMMFDTGGDENDRFYPMEQPNYWLEFNSVND